MIVFLYKNIVVYASNWDYNTSGESGADFEGCSVANGNHVCVGIYGYRVSSTCNPVTSENAGILGLLEKTHFTLKTSCYFSKSGLDSKRCFLDENFTLTDVAEFADKLGTTLEKMYQDGCEFRFDPLFSIETDDGFLNDINAVTALVLGENDIGPTFTKINNYENMHFYQWGGAYVRNLLGTASQDLNCVYERSVSNILEDKYCIDKSYGTLRINKFISKKGKITITKLEKGTTNKLNGSKFRLYKGSGCTGTKVKEFTVNGSYTIDNLEPGTYSLEEVSPPPGYSKQASCPLSKITIQDGDNKLLSVYNEKKPIEVKIEKRDSKTNQLIFTGSAKFEIYDDSQCRDYTYWYDDTCASSTNNYCYGSIVYDPVQKKDVCNGKTGYHCYSERGWQTVNHSMGSVTTNKGVASISLPGGKSYYIKETSAPKGYVNPPSDNNYVWSGCSWCKYKQPLSKNCYPISSSSTTVIYNENSCETIFNGLNKNSMDDRIWAYRYFKEFIPNKVNYNGLLNLSNDTAAKACKHYDCTKTSTTECLSGKYENKNFDSTNLSCYNSIYSTSSGGTAYCLESFELINDLNTSNWTISSGKMPIQKLTYNSSIAAKGELIRKCYKYSTHADEQDNKPNSYDEYRGKLEPPKYDNYISSVKLDNLELKHDEVKSEPKEIDKNNWYEYHGKTNYYLNEIFSKVGTGDISYNKQKNYKSIGYGVVSQFNKKERYNIPFSLKLGARFPLPSSQKEYSSNKCIVDPTQEIITTDNGKGKLDELRLEFRIIDTSNPFPGKSGSNNRVVGQNWRVKWVDTNGDGKVNIKDVDLNNDNKFDYKDLDLMKSDYTKYDFNKDGKLDNKDIKFFNYILEYIGKHGKYPNGRKSGNLYIKYIIETTNNSYDKNKTGAKYTIKLTPSNIRKIKSYNASHKYDDFTLNCDSNGENCKLSEEFKKVVTVKGI